MQIIGISILRLALALALAFFSIVNAHLQAQTAQTGKFSSVTKEFVEQLETFMTASKRPDLEEAFAVFKKQINGGALQEPELARIITVCNQLAGLNLTPYPHFLNYLHAIDGAKNQSDQQYFNQWHTALEPLAASTQKGKVKTLGLFLEFSNAFNSPDHAIKSGAGGAVTWKIVGGATSFGFEGELPVLHATNIDLMGYRKQDSCIIRQTSGVFYPGSEEWRGQGGKVDWRDAGLDASVYAELTQYRIEVVKPLVKCDSALMYYPLYFANQPVPGRFEDNVIAESRVNRPYPKFESFEKNLVINKIGDNIGYIGGFRLSGASFYGYGTRQEPAQLTLFNAKRERIFYGTAELFIIRREKSITAEEVNAKLYMDKDSLFHPAVGFRVDIPKQLIQLTRGQKGNERNPFYSSFYNMNLDVEKISWNVLKDSLEIGAQIAGVKGVKQTVGFESSDRFDISLYNRMQHIIEKNPVAILYVLALETNQDAEERGVRQFLVSDNAFAQAMNPNFDYSSIQTLLAQMVKEGFINYYFDEHVIELRDKLILYAKASQGKCDYDAIYIESVSDTTNAKLDLKTKETAIFQVKKIELSHKQHVAFMPNNKQMTLLKNRDMRFTGRLFAGFALFEGKDMYFNYDKFQVEFDSVRNLDFYLPTGEMDKLGQPVANAMNSTVEKLSGVLLVDAAHNKSGKEKLPIFPSLQSKKPSFVFYDRKSTQGGVYTRDSFYFKLDPFSFDGLDSYTADQLKFKGEMTAATIFPSFRETIVVRDEDKSFGFVHKTPKNGYPTYAKKGNYTGELDLSNKGFFGKGTVEYLNADIVSDDITFRPRQMLATAKTFFLEEDRASVVKTPQARGENVQVNWLPYRDSMYLDSKTKAFDLFREPGYTHKGRLILTPSGLKGRGEFEWFGGKLTSKLISYGPFQASADTADLQIKSGEKIAFDAKNIDGELDFDKQRGDFKANSSDASITLPFDQIQTSMNEFSWDMKAQNIKFKSDPNKPGFFISTDKTQDSLSWYGKTAFYDIPKNILGVGGVEVIKSADAFIYPDSQYLEVQPEGHLKQLTNSKIVADTVNKYHTITRAVIDINGKKSYKATGFYQYDIPGFKQEVFFNNIIGERVGGGTPSKQNVLTTANGEIAESDSFHMDAKTLFRGEIILKANKPNMRFEGYAKLTGEKLPEPQWFSVYTDVDKNDPTLRIKNTKNDTDDPLITGFYISQELGEMYPRILQPAYRRVDRALMDCEGVVKYDGKTDRFLFGDSLKVLGLSQRGSKMVFDNKIATVEAQGPINIGSGLKYMKIKAAGRLKSDFNKVDTAFFKVTGELMTGMEITLPKSLIDIMVADIRANTFDVQPGIYSNNMAYYQPVVSEFVKEDKDLPEVMTNLQANLVQLPKKDDTYTFVLGRHAVIWNTDYQSFVSTDDRFPMISIKGEPINKVFNMFVEYKMPGNEDDRFYFYVRPTADQWYYFGYNGGVLEVASSNPRFNEALLGLKTKDTQIKMPDGELYEILPAAPAKADAFISRVREGRKQ